MVILVVAAHPDDETLGCGGAIARHREAGDEVLAVRFTDGVGARSLATDSEATAYRREAAEAAARSLGFSWLAAGDFPDNALDSVPLLEVVQFLESVTSGLSPDVVYTHHPGDLNIDHRRVFEATLTAFRPAFHAPTPSVRTFEVPSSTEWSHGQISGRFRPSIFVNIGPHWSRKVDALNCYDAELREPPHPRSLSKIETLARYRGAEVGLELAEAFGSVREVVQ